MTDLECRHKWVVTSALDLVDSAGWQLQAQCMKCGEQSEIRCGYGVILHPEPPLDSVLEQIKPAST